ncbi:MAG TPA: hypothetical protein VNQ90_04675, partial [Chthoniobacteraceae bacterium]|nr:hypothetical protein [Chthoniobacteraceae bacterium]
MVSTMALVAGTVLSQAAAPHRIMESIQAEPTTSALPEILHSVAAPIIAPVEPEASLQLSDHSRAAFDTLPGLDRYLEIKRKQAETAPQAKGAE